MYIKSGVFIACFVYALISSLAYAKPPFVDYQISPIPWEVATCLEDAATAMEAIGLTESGSTGDTELVGYKGNYKAVIACVDSDEDGQAEMTLFIVAGAVYQRAYEMATQLKQAWESSY